MDVSATVVTYAYCVVHRAARPPTTRVPAGLRGASRPDLLDLGGSLWCVIADAPLAEYSEARIEEGLRRLEWVGAIAVAHEEVVEHFAKLKGATVVPMKLFTLFSTRARALAEMRGRRRELTAIVKRIRGCHEWGIRVSRVAGVLSRPPRFAKGTSGVGFLAAKKRSRDDARNAGGRTLTAAEEAFDMLARVAKDARRRHEAPEGAAAPPLVNAAFLVPAARSVRFRQAARRASRACRAAGAELRLTGPWPAYNFVQTADPSYARAEQRT